MTKKSFKKVHYGTNSVQKGGRVQLPKPLLLTMGLNVGDDIEILLDVEKREIILKAQEKGSQT